MPRMLILGFALYLGFAALAAAQTPTVALPVRGGAPGETLSIPVTVTNATFMAVDLAIDYDPTLLQATAVDKGALATDWFVIPTLATPGQVLVSMMGIDNIGTAGELIVIRFTVKADATYNATCDLTFTNAKLYGATTITPATTHGSFKVVDPNPPGAAVITTAYNTPNAGGNSISVLFNRSPDDGAGQNDVIRYDILRSTSPGSGFAVIGTVAPAGEPAYTYLDNPANSTPPPENGVNYYYIVRAHDNTNQTDSNVRGPVAASFVVAYINQFGVAGVRVPADDYVWLRGAVEVYGAADVDGAQLGGYVFRSIPGTSPPDDDVVDSLHFYAVPSADPSGELNVIDTHGLYPRQDTPPGEATFYIRMTVFDSYTSNWSESNVDKIVIIDNTPPLHPRLTLSAPPPQETFVKNGDTVQLRGESEPHAELVAARLVSENGATIADVFSALHMEPSGVFAGSVTVANFGTATRVRFEAEVRDRAGNLSGAGLSTGALIVDNDLPTVAILTPLDQSLYATSPIPIRGRVADSTSRVVRVELSTDGGTSWIGPEYGVQFDGRTFAYDFVPHRPNFMYALRARAFDRNGHPANSNSVTVSYFLNQGTAVLLSPLDGAEIFGPPALAIHGTVMHVAAWTLDWRKSDGATWTVLATGGGANIVDGLLATWQHDNALADGDYHLRLTAPGATPELLHQITLSHRRGPPPQPPIYLTPEWKAQGVPPVNTTFTWSEVEGATKYILYIRRKGGAE